MVPVKSCTLFILTTQLLHKHEQVFLMHQRACQMWHLGGFFDNLVVCGLICPPHALYTLIITPAQQ